MSTSVQNLPPVASPLDSAPLAVRAFVAAHDLAEHLTTALSIGARTFPAGSQVALQVEEDPEIEGKWIVVDWSLGAAVDEALPCYRRFVTEWTAAAPPGVGNFLRFTFHLV
jgi:hypothetical protein